MAHALHRGDGCAQALVGSSLALAIALAVALAPLRAAPTAPPPARWPSDRSSGRSRRAGSRASRSTGSSTPSRRSGARGTIEDRRVGHDQIQRRITFDGRIDSSKSSRIAGGRFRRRVLVKRIAVKRGERPWTDAEAPHLVSKARQGVAYDTTRDRVQVRFFQPYAERVQLVIEGEKKPVELTPVASGIWEKSLGTAPRRLYGKEYHFRVVRKDGSVERIADPFADFTERTADRVISRFTDLEFTWRDHSFQPPALEDIVLYESHLPALSRHPSSGVAARAPRHLPRRDVEQGGRAPEEARRRGRVPAAQRRRRPARRRLGLLDDLVPRHERALRQQGAEDARQQAT